MEKKLYRSPQKMLPVLLTGFSLTYIPLDNIFGGPLREFLGNYISLNEFGSNIREEVLYYLILVVGGFQLFTAVQSIFQPVLELSEYKIAMRTSEKLFTVVKNIQDLQKATLHEDYITFTFNDATYSVFIKNIEAYELESLLDELNG